MHSALIAGEVNTEKARIQVAIAIKLQEAVNCTVLIQYNIIATDDKFHAYKQMIVSGVYSLLYV